MGIDAGKFDKITDPAGLAGGKAGKWADPLGIISKPKDTSAEDAARREAERQAKIDATIGEINTLYDSAGRKRQVAEYGADLLNYLTTDANRQKVNADRDLRFALARSGQVGGSVQVDKNRDLGEEYQRGILEAARRSQAGMANLKSADAQSRLNLTALAQNGLSTGSAASQAAASMQAALESASAGDRAQGLGDIFTSVASAKAASEKSAAQRRADKLYTTLYPGSIPVNSGGFG
jgi:hypothetical protein